jgi:hypothetical protein
MDVKGDQFMVNGQWLKVYSVGVLDRQPTKGSTRGR